MNRILSLPKRHRWIWAALGVLVLWVALSIATERFSLHSISGVARSASFLALVALGQMFVIATGRGNIDLSVAGIVTLSAFVTVTLADGSNLHLPIALGAALLTGLVVGLINAFMVVRLKIAAMIATLAMGYILATATLMVNRQVRGFETAPALEWLASGRIGDLPVIALVAILAAALAAFLLNATAYGQSLSATGQNIRAAELAGVRTGRTVTISFVISGVSAAFAGALLSANVGGAFLDMGTPYLLQSVGAVVLGGSLIFGGFSTALGTLFGALLLVLIVTTMQIWGLPAGAQDVVQGIVIIAVLAFAGGIGAKRRSAPRRT
ncbi:ABC transporter permease [Acuticoccus sp. M5D2P5]|uniref:ABC transporter permease n=1 Tax=Acuticoccus kalidii TaxID=2910977 RepID=UPI001F1883B6|nr:ABC transporter permease [Acuticoccus kalidii]MCF3936513.1 ABC transporter permease [Acuticoccus kalidii]